MINFSRTSTGNGYKICDAPKDRKWEEGIKILSTVQLLTLFVERQLKAMLWSKVRFAAINAV